MADPQSLAKIDAVIQTLTALDYQQLPPHQLPNLLEDVKSLSRHPERLLLDDALAQLRETLIVNYGLWFLPNTDWVQDLVRFADSRPIVELMAGNAALSAALKAQGHVVTAVDNLDWSGQDNQRPVPWTAVSKQAALTAVKESLHKADDPNSQPIFVMAWAPDTSDDDWKILQYLRSQSQPFHLIVIGEKNGATNSKKFWQEADLELNAVLNQHYQAFDMIQDVVYLVH
ncbi:SAM-dependent methyltransferase [Fructobacillus americanaquae]|uniref:SAM-dependent methyltransferase n=1 Tax=Fructobacillus americanaquae TaxID=2940302 RepID=A0ABY5C0Q6_9LACO|nr:SAM-dependent methyltransferase [Fructobacillus americanaquae]USS92359.1 SAM-dependent methyltransferase [Fructobacillus americanaquae]